jgi:hypothetical protein
VANVRKPVVVADDESDERVADREQRSRYWAIIEGIGERNSDKDPDQVLRDVTSLVEQIRLEAHERETHG